MNVKHVYIDDMKIIVDKRELEDCHGQFVSKKLTITIDPTFPEEVQRRTLVHELMHAVIYVRNQYVVENIIGMTDKDLIEETMCECFGTYFYRVLVNNPKLREYLFNE